MTNSRLNDSLPPSVPDSSRRAKIPIVIEKNQTSKNQTLHDQDQLPLVDDESDCDLEFTAMTPKSNPVRKREKKLTPPVQINADLSKNQSPKMH